jgi:hypothetical protein
MTEAELERIEHEITFGTDRLFAAHIVAGLLLEVRRLRKICADTLPVMETALRAGLDFDEATTQMIITSHATIKALRSALS